MPTFDFDAVPGAIPDTPPVGTAGDFAKTLGAGAIDIGSNLAGLGRYAQEGLGNENAAELYQGLEKIFGAGADATRDTMNPETRKLAASTMTSPEFWEHPVLASSLKVTGMAPSLVAMAVPGGLLADTVGATMAVAGTGAALSAGTGVDEFYKKLDEMSDAELQQQSPRYAAIREFMGEREARAKFNREAQGWAPAINALVGAATSATGAPGMVARRVAGGTGEAVLGAAGRGPLASGAIGAAEGGLGNAAQSGVADVLSQQSDVEANFAKDMDYARAANAALEGGVFGGALGGLAGAVLHGRAPQPDTAKAATRQLDSADVDRPVATTDVPPPIPDTSRATATPAKPPETAQVGTPQNAPTGSDRVYEKPVTVERKGRKKASKEEVGVAPPQGPDVTQAAAIEAAEPVAEAPDVAAAVARLTEKQPQQPPAVPQVTPQVASGAPPPEVQQAAQRLPEPPAGPVDTGMNVPEPTATLAAQQAQVGTGNRKAVMYPAGTKPPEVAPGMKRISTPRGVVDFDPAQVKGIDVLKAVKAGRENELLGLGPVTKAEAVQRTAAGETPVAVVERTPQGTEVKAAAGTEQTAPVQVATLEANKTPGNVVQLEQPGETVARRNATGGRILPNLATTAETTPIGGEVTKAQAAKNQAAAEKVRAREEADFQARLQGKPGIGEEVVEEAVTGKNRTVAEKAALKERTDKANQIIADHLPQDDEKNFERNPAARNRVIARARSMVARANADEVAIPKQLRRSAEGGAGDEPALQILRLAADLLKVADKHKEGKAITDATTKFRVQEALVKAGHGEEVRAQRREEGDTAMNRRRQNESAEQVTAAKPVEEAPAEEVAGEAPIPAETAKEAEDKITTATKAPKGVVKLDDGTEEVAGQTRAKAATGDKLAEDAERKAKLIAEMNAKYGAPGRAPTKMPSEQNALRINRNPTEAQKKAGNYKKGHRSVEGLDFTIENPKGAVRRGRGPEGEWSVRMPADYGYIRRTVGADGDHIDAYDLRNGKRYFVVDQVDPNTGKFDEHKLMLRAKDEDAARAAYEAAFSDGTGKSRMGHIHELSLPELKEWLKTGDHKKSHLQKVLDEVTDHTFTPPKDAGVTDTITLPDGSKVKSVRSEYLANELERFDFSRIPGVGGTLAKFFQSRFQKIADATDTIVHYVRPEDLGKMSGSDNAAGLHWFDDNGTSHIALDADLKDQGVKHGSLAHVLLHETAHAVTVRELNNSPTMRKTVNRLMRIAADWMEHPDHAAHVEMLYGPGNPEGDMTRYAFTNEKEFIAEAFSNRGFQELLTQIPVNDPVLRSMFNFDRKRMSMWDVFRGFVKKAVERITGHMPQFDSVLDSIMRVGEVMERQHHEQFVQATPEARRSYTDSYVFPDDSHTLLPPPHLAESDAFRLQRSAKDTVERMLSSPHLNTQERGPFLLKLRTFDNIAQIADHYFGEGNPVRKIHNAIERMRVTSEGIFAKSEPLMQKLVALRAKDSEAFGEFSSLLHDATVANVHPDVPLTDAKNAHLGKKRVVGSAVWAKAAHPELARRFNQLPEDYKQAWHEVTKHFADTQNAMSLGIIENRILKALGIEDEALARRIHEGTTTDADRARVGEDMLDTIEQASELSKIEGPYAPLMRRGDHVVKADIKIAPPPGAKKLSDNEFEFADQKDAEAYAKKQKLQTRIKKVWVDENTGETHEADPVTGEMHKVSAKDLHAVPRWRAEVQNRHVEFVDGRAAAERRAAELAADGSMDVHKVVPRAFEVSGRQATELSASLQRLLSKMQKSEAYKQSTPTQQAMLRQAVEEAAVASHGSTRIQSKSLPRRGVAGYSEDLVKNTAEYGESSSRYLAKLEHMPAVEAGMKAMEEQLGRDHSKVNQYGRTLIRNEVVKRVNGDNGFEQAGKFSPVVKRLMAISFIDKLASPAYSVVNSMQPGMVTMPYLAGRHGLVRSVSALAKAYSDIGAGGIVKKGLKETALRVRGKGTPDDFITNAKDLLKSSDEKKLIEYFVEHGVVDPSAGMEVREMARDYAGVGGKVDAVIGYLEGVTREMPRAIEAINRLTSGLAAYRLERGRGASHEQALQYAHDTVNNTQFNYSPTNSPMLFNHPLAKMAFQFKKYGQGMYQLIGGQIGKALRGATPGERAEAVKTLIAVAGTHMAMAGALGLPTEPFKYLVMASGLVGGPQWGDVEDKIRKVAADVLGKTGGEVFSRGLPRLINLDLSRVGLDSVTSFGEPRTGKEADVLSWLFKTISGPVAALGVDYAKGINQIAHGDFEKAAEGLIPIKAASDTLRAYRQLTEGKKSASGKQTSQPYSFVEAAMRAAGFGSAREAEEGAANSAYYRNSERQKEQRTELVNDWVNAKPAEKMRAMAAITKWNAGQVGEVKITPKNLTDALKKRQKDEKTAVRGIVADKRSKHFLEEGAYYNTR